VNIWVWIFHIKSTTYTTLYNSHCQHSQHLWTKLKLGLARTLHVYSAFFKTCTHTRTRTWWWTLLIDRHLERYGGMGSLPAWPAAHFLAGSTEQEASADKSLKKWPHPVAGFFFNWGKVYRVMQTLVLWYDRFTPLQVWLTPPKREMGSGCSLFMCPLRGWRAIQECGGVAAIFRCRGEGVLRHWKPHCPSHMWTLQLYRGVLCLSWSTA